MAGMFASLALVPFAAAADAAGVGRVPSGGSPRHGRYARRGRPDACGPRSAPQPADTTGGLCTGSRRLAAGAALSAARGMCLRREPGTPFSGRSPKRAEPGQRSGWALRSLACPSARLRHAPSLTPRRPRGSCTPRRNSALASGGCDAPGSSRNSTGRKADRSLPAAAAIGSFPLAGSRKQLFPLRKFSARVSIRR